jgi:hypothetical protein
MTGAIKGLLRHLVQLKLPSSHCNGPSMTMREPLRKAVLHGEWDLVHLQFGGRRPLPRVSAGEGRGGVFQASTDGHGRTPAGTEAGRARTGRWGEGTVLRIDSRSPRCQIDLQPRLPPLIGVSTPPAKRIWMIPPSRRCSRGFSSQPSDRRTEGAICRAPGRRPCACSCGSGADDRTPVWMTKGSSMCSRRMGALCRLSRRPPVRR